MIQLKEFSALLTECNGGIQPTDEEIAWLFRVADRRKCRVRPDMHAVSVFVAVPARNCLQLCPSSRASAPISNAPSCTPASRSAHSYHAMQVHGQSLPATYQTLNAHCALRTYSKPSLHGTLILKTKVQSTRSQRAHMLKHTRCPLCMPAIECGLYTFCSAARACRNSLGATAKKEFAKSNIKSVCK
jgi:hypothetical protein